MNRKKKMNSMLNKRMKKANAKLHSSNKPKYISKADRAKMELEQQDQTAVESSSEEQE